MEEEGERDLDMITERGLGVCGLCVCGLAEFAPLPLVSGAGARGGDGEDGGDGGVVGAGRGGGRVLGDGRGCRLLTRRSGEEEEGWGDLANWQIGNGK